MLGNINASQHHTPFGSLMPQRFQSAEKYRYGYNGKESDNEVKGTGTQYDYGFRIYDPRIVKFLSVDPLTASYPWYTPYQFSGNTPIQAIDLDGLEPKYIIKENGKLTRPVIKLFNAAFNYNMQTMHSSTWRGVNKVNHQNSDAMVMWKNIMYNKNLNNKEIYTEDDWFKLAAHEHKHRDEMGDSYLTTWAWYAGYTAGFLSKGDYRANPYEERAYEMGHGMNDAMGRLLMNYGSEIYSTLKSNMFEDQKEIRMEIIGLKHQLDETNNVFNKVKNNWKNSEQKEYLQNKMKDLKGKIFGAEKKMEEIDNNYKTE